MFVSRAHFQTRQLKTVKTNPQLEGFFTDLFKQPLKTVQKQVLPFLSPVLTGGLSIVSPKLFGIKGHESMKAYRLGRNITVGAVAAVGVAAAPAILGTSWGALGSGLLGGAKSLFGGIGSLFGGGPSSVGPQAPGSAGAQQYTGGPVVAPWGTVYPTGTMVAPDGTIVGPDGSVLGQTSPGTVFQPAPAGSVIGQTAPYSTTAGPSLFSGLVPGIMNGLFPSPKAPAPGTAIAPGAPPTGPSPYGPPMIGPGGQVYPPGTAIAPDGSIVGPDGTILGQAPIGTSLTPQTGPAEAGIMGPLGGTTGLLLGAGALGMMVLVSSTMKKKRRR